MYNASIYIGLFTPGRVGEASRVFYLKKEHSVGKSFVSIILDRLADIVFLLLFGYFSMFLFLDILKQEVLLFGVIISAVLLLAVLALKSRLPKNFLKKAGVGVGLGLSLLLPFLAAAQIPGPIITSPTDIANIINAILNWLSGIILVISIIMFFWAAIMYMTAGASETTLGKSKTVLIYAIVGLAVAILTYSFKPFLETFFRAAF